MFDVRLRHSDHVRHYSISALTPQGWEVRLEEDRQIRRRDVYQDWHRVERALLLLELEVLRLREHGWHEV
jgi:hypothetical protein